MTGQEHPLRLRLRQTGYDDSALSAVWPSWWSAEAAESPSAEAELRFSLAKRLGLDPRRLLEADEPRFVWKGESKFKHLHSESEWEREALGSYGIATGRALAQTIGSSLDIQGINPMELRAVLLESNEVVDLASLLSFCWSVAIPVIQLRVFPLKQKRMAAMCVQTPTGFAILIAKESNYPAPIAFFLAHEIGHIALGHLGSSAALLDFSRDLEELVDSDNDENEADRFALQLLTGMQAPSIDASVKEFSSAQLAEGALRAGPKLRVEPGILALCCGHTTERWAQVMNSLKIIYDDARPVWAEINALAGSQMDWSSLPDSTARSLQNIMELFDESSRR